VGRNHFVNIESVILNNKFNCSCYILLPEFISSSCGTGECLLYRAALWTFEARPRKEGRKKKEKVEKYAVTNELRSADLSVAKASVAT